MQPLREGALSEATGKDSHADSGKKSRDFRAEKKGGPDEI